MYNVQTTNFELGEWSIEAKKSHILQSKCFSEPPCSSNEGTELCDICRYEQELELPQLPEMTFAINALKLKHSSGIGIEFNALDALKLVDSKNDVMKVAVAEAWQESRMDNSQIRDVVKPFDWTYSTHYKGSFLGDKNRIKVSETDERIDLEKLKVKDKILFYEDIMLFEDELADNGTAHCSVKIRVMPDSFFVLLRFFLRVDGLLVRIIDTRLHYLVGNNYLIREHAIKENKIADLKVSSSLLTNPQELWDHLQTVSYEYEKMEFS